MDIPYHFIAATKAKAEEVNENFQAVKEAVENCINKIDEANTNSTGAINSLKDYVYPIGLPVITLDSTLDDSEIWLEGGEVSKETYSALYAIYGDDYGTAKDSNNFVLPDFRNRAIWGADSFGYISAGLPNITGSFGGIGWTNSGGVGGYSYSGAFSGSTDRGALNGGNSMTVAFKNGNFDASLSSEIYGNSETVQPPAIKIRVKTRYM